MTLQTPTDASRGTQTPAQVAALLGVHPNTVRAWCGEFADVLSDSARSRPRLLSPSDVAVLQLVAQLRAEGLTYSEVLQRLRETPRADIAQPYIDAAPAVPAQPTEAQAETLRSVDARLQRLEAQRLLWIGAAVGLVAGLVLGVIAAAVLLRG